jgi:hypothetical protein
LKKFRPLGQFDATGFKRFRILVAKWNSRKSILEPMNPGILESFYFCEGEDP